VIDPTFFYTDLVIILFGGPRKRTAAPIRIYRKAPRRGSLFLPSARAAHHPQDNPDEEEEDPEDLE
jgi:hypothetical protein